MSRVLLIGQGPLPAPQQQYGGFAQLRTWHFHRELTAAGHDVRLVLLQKEQATEKGSQTPAAWATIHRVHADGAGWLEQCNVLATGADVVVTAGPYSPGRAGVAAAGDHLPLWVDVPGDPYAELDAVRRASESTPPAARFAAACAAYEPVLSRADALSPVSSPQRFAMLGQLGQLGRTHPLPHIATIPVSFTFPFSRRPPRPRSANEPLCIALAGSANPWLDLEMMTTAMDQVFKHRPDTRLVVTGGPVPSLPNQGWKQLKEWAASNHQRVRLLGWVPEEQLPDIIGEAHLGIFTDEPIGLEPGFGDRTRALLYAWLGLDLVATDRTQRLQELSAAGLALASPAGDPDAFAHAILTVANRDRQLDRHEALVQHLDHQSSPSSVAAPLLEWLKAPHRVPPALSHASVLGAERDRLQDELQTVYESPTWRALSRIQRSLRGGP